MTIFIDAQSTSDLTSYTGLIACVGRWLERADLSDDAPDFVRMAEARFRRLLVMPEMETTISLAPTGSIALPVDFDSARSFGIPGYRQFDVMSAADFEALPLNTDGTPLTGQPLKVLYSGSTALLWPIPDQTYAATLTYRADLPPLSASNQSNWLLAKHPDAYLYATLLQAEFYGWNDDRIPLMKAALDETLDEITMSGNRKRFGGGPLVMKPASHERLRVR